VETRNIKVVSPKCSCEAWCTREASGCLYYFHYVTSVPSLRGFCGLSSAK